MNDTTVHYHVESTTEGEPLPQGVCSSIFGTQGSAMRYLVAELADDAAMLDGEGRFLSLREALEGLSVSLPYADVTLPLALDVSGFRYSVTACSACSLTLSNGEPWRD